MKKFLRLLFICSSALLVLASCSSFRTKGFSKQALPDSQFTPVFDESFRKALYEVDITYSKKNISGVAVIKKMETNQSFRMVLMSETGLKFFDFEFFPKDSTVVHYVMDAMNRKKIVRTFTRDLGLILQINSDQKALTYFDENGKQPIKIRRKSFLSPATEVEISYNTEGIPATIAFTHGIINLKMTFKLINERQ